MKKPYPRELCIISPETSLPGLLIRVPLGWTSKVAGNWPLLEEAPVSSTRIEESPITRAPEVAVPAHDMQAKE